MRPEMPLRSVLVVILCLGCAAPAFSQEAPDQQAPGQGASHEIPGVPYAETSKYLVKLVHWERYGPTYDEYRFRFWVRDREDGSEGKLELVNRTNELRKLYVLDDLDLLIVMGAIRNIADVVTIFDLNRNQEVDSFLAYGPEISSTRRYVIYKRFYPRFSEPPATSDVVLVYDLAASPSANRIEGAEQSGIPIYPEENTRAAEMSVWVEAEEERHRVDPGVGYLWLENDRLVAFVDRRGGSTDLVVVDLSQGLDSPTIHQETIDVRTLLSIDPDSEDYDAILENERRELRISSLRRTDQGSILVVFDRQKWEVEGLYRWSQMEIEIPSEEDGGPEN